MEPCQRYALIWRHTHKDYNGMIDGKRYVLRWVDGIGTCSIPLGSLSDQELARELAYALRHEHYSADC